MLNHYYSPNPPIPRSLVLEPGPIIPSLTMEPASSTSVRRTARRRHNHRCPKNHTDPSYHSPIAATMQLPCTHRLGRHTILKRYQPASPLGLEGGIAAMVPQVFVPWQVSEAGRRVLMAVLAVNHPKADLKRLPVHRGIHSSKRFSSTDRLLSPRCD